MSAFSIADLITVPTLALAAAVFLSRRLRASESWRATVTPLASIIGSGFLVSLPLLATAVGVFAPLAMALLVGAAYLIGGAIRFNIIHGEPLFDDTRHATLHWLEQLSHVALAVAYVISVTYYLSLLAAFLLKLFGVAEPLAARATVTTLLVFIGAYGFIRGLRGLEGIEEYAVGLKLAVIAAVLAGLAWLNVRLALAGNWSIQAGMPILDWHAAQIVLGMLIVVQGFETSRFLKGAYSPDLRVQTMRSAQLISGAIYLVFFGLALVTFNGNYRKDDVAAITDIVAMAAFTLPFMLTAGAIFAQLSAAIADAIGGAGLMTEIGRLAVDRRRAYPFIAFAGVLITWSTNVFELIALASKAFAVFYFLQCVVAAVVAARAPKVEWRVLRTTGFVTLALAALAVVVFGLPVEGG